MSHSQPVTKLIGQLWLYVEPRRRVQFALVLVLLVVASLFEAISIGSVLPFLTALTAPAHLIEQPALRPFMHALGITSPDQLLLPLTVTFALTALAAGMLRLLLLWASTRLSFSTGADLGISIYRRTLFQPYSVHVRRNSSEIIDGITTKASAVIYGVIWPGLTLISSATMLVAILALLLAIEPVISLVVCCGFSLIYGFIIWNTREKKILNGRRIARESTKVIKSLQEGLGGIRDVLIDGSQEIYCQSYRKSDVPLRTAQGNNQFLSQSPRYSLEALGLVLIAALAYTLALQPDGLSKAIPILGTLALAAQRLLPVMQQVYAAWSSIQSNQASLEDTLMLLSQPLPEHAGQPPAIPQPFHTHIRLRSLSFRYLDDGPWILRDLDLSIERGSRVGLIGTTGSGKSTLLDILMGLLEPTDGMLEIDGEPITHLNRRAWQSHIAHVPQAIFLSDSSVEENIAFGQPRDRIDHERVRMVARQAQIADTIESWPEQYKTPVGERGVRLSGGQRQRLGIARALYKAADVIVFDEATSALDNETENAVMGAIDSLGDDLTIIMVAHRLSTLANCTQVVELEEGSVRRIGTYSEIVLGSN